MIYTIASLDICHTPCNIDSEIHGNMYVVSYYNKETRENTTRKFEDREKALFVYTTLVEYAIRGYYSEADRRKILLNMA